MGKKKSASTSGATKVSRDWGASSISNREVNKLRTLGLISASDDDIRLPGPASRPKPPKGFTVMFVAFLFRGLSLPAHEFLCSLLFFYGIQLWLTPNSILHLSIFIAKLSSALIPTGSLEENLLCQASQRQQWPPPVVGGVGFVVRKEVDYFNYPMKESVQGWRNKWFYLRDTPVSGRRSNLPPFEDVLVAQPKKSWRNTLSPEESTIADKLFDQVVDLKNTGGLTMCDTEVVSVFLQRRVQPLMSRPHQLWLYVGKDDKSRVSSADLSNDELRDEVRRLTCLSMKDNIVLNSARLPYDLKHLPAEASTVAQCYPPSLESGVEPEDDDDDSEETEDVQHILEDSDVQEDEAPEDDAFIRSRWCKRINEDLITTAESNPSGQDNDADETAPPSPAVKVDAVVDFVEQFTRLESENAHLRETAKTSADQVLEANKLAADARNENILLKDELKKLKQKMKDEQDARREAAIAADKQEGVLRESIANLLDSFIFYSCRCFFKSFG
ncbi:hypothetical protein QYE76_019378 [Lolium multiflorum]|uniref:Transposase (putative) gypsy type domain-containing protein n=1 Tax=Lolium multiflorum TaxID=4521 RepID=A0AAD8R3U9_LOLMU|nr:hypothetical protein QYE76_019378 [Lolium multiflorum]